MIGVAEQLATIPPLVGRIHPVARLAQLLEKGGLAQICPAAFVLPLGLRGGTPDAITGLYRQPLTRLVGVVLAVRHVGDATGAKADEQLQPLVDAAIAAIVGWGPDPDVSGTYALVKGELISVAAGTLTYQLDFTLDDQLRIPR